MKISEFYRSTTPLCRSGIASDCDDSKLISRNCGDSDETYLYVSEILMKARDYEEN